MLILYQKSQFSPFLIRFSLIGIFLQYIAQLLTFCRAGIIGTSLAISIFFFLHYKKKALIIIPLVAILIVSFVSSFIVAKGNVSTVSRFLLMVPAYNMLVESKSAFLWGYGPTYTFDAYAYFRDFFFIAEKVNNPHNTVVSMAIMFGVLFTVIMLFFGGSLLFKGSLKAITVKNKNENVIYSFLVVILVGLFVQGLFDSALLMPEYFDMQFYLLFLGILYKLTDKKPTKILKEFFNY
ncbi:MAG: hypothetical protein JSS63_04275 [Bacteroidetes bacterium]|nr:hypothetical protein [Bacteroidota bacterium]